MEQDIIILYAHQFSRTNANGQTETGIEIWYYPAASLDPRKDVSDRSNKTWGLIPCKAVIPVTKSDQLRSVPGLYTARFINVPAGDSGYKCKLTDVIFKSDFRKGADEDYIDEF